MASDDDLHWDDLRYFLQAARTKTLAGAARAMGVEHTTIGRRLSSLERALGAALVLRGPEGLSLTTLGEQVVPLAEELERTVRTLRNLAQAESTRVRLAVPSGFTQLFTPGLAALRRKHPGLSLELVSGSRQVDLKKGEADLALRSGPIGDQALVARKVGESGSSLYASKSYLERHPPPRDLDDLCGHELIGYDESLAELPAAKWVERRAKGATIVLRSREMTDMVAAALSGVGLALVPCILGDAEPRLVRLSDEALATRSFSLVYRREAKLSAAVRAVIGFVTEVMREHAVAMRGAAPTRASTRRR